MIKLAFVQIAALSSVWFLWSYRVPQFLSNWNDFWKSENTQFTQYTQHSHLQMGIKAVAYLRMFIGATPSHVLVLGLYRSTEFRQLVPSLPPAT